MSIDHFVLERQLLLQLGDRLQRLRKSQRLSAVEMASRVGISRTTLTAVEAGDPGPAMGTYLKVMGQLGMAGDLALLAGDVLRAAPMGSAGARSQRAQPQVQVRVSSESAKHQVQDLQSLALHEAAVRLIRAEPELLRAAQDTLTRWLATRDSRSASLWREWQDLLEKKAWRKVLGRTMRAQELRQASPLPTLLPKQQRLAILAQIAQLKAGVVLRDDSN